MLISQYTLNNLWITYNTQTQYKHYIKSCYSVLFKEDDLEQVHICSRYTEFEDCQVFSICGSLIHVELAKMENRVQ